MAEVMAYKADDEVRYNLIPTIKKFHECPAQIRAAVGPVGCYSGDTEFLTPTGWVRFDAYEEGMQTAQWNHTSKDISFVFPDSYIKEPCAEFIHFHNEHSLSMMLSDEHRMPLYNYRGRFKVKNAATVAKTPSRYTIPTNFRVRKDGYNLTDNDIRLMVAVHADGNIPAVGHKCRIVVRKECTKERLVMLLGRSGIEFTTGGSQKRPTEVWFAFKPPRSTKTYAEWGWELSERQLKIVVDELQYWDGLFEGADYRFSSTDKRDADFIQYAVHATGGRATISKETYIQPNGEDCYCVHIALPGSYKAKVMLRGDTTSIERVLSLDGLKYCFTVPTGFLVVRHDGRVFISGNSGKTTAATWEVCYFLPHYLYKKFGMKKTRWVVVRNTSIELRDTTLATVKEWFDFGRYRVQAMIMNLVYPGDNGETFEVEILFRACDNEKHVRQFKSLEITGYWVDESIEVSDSTKHMLKTRIGRYPRKSPVRFGIETTNPPDIEHTMYSQFKWDSPPPGPVPEAGKVLDNHVGFWQPPYENVANLRPGYYDDLRKDYADNPDWAEMYIEGKPGQLIRGKMVYANFKRDVHVALDSLEWGGQTLYRGWDNSGNTPACIVVCPVSPQRLHVLKEFHTDRENIVDFTNRVIEDCNESYPGGKYIDFGDPAGQQTFSTREGAFTSNAGLQASECGVVVLPSQQNMTVRVNAIDQALLKRDGMLIDPRCTRLINGFLGGYHYPELKGMPGVFKKEVEKNKFSHCFDGDTPVSVGYKGNIRKIRNITVGDKVATPDGLKKVTAVMSSISNDRLRLTFSNGKTLVCTKEHPFFTKNTGIVLADALQYNHVLLSINKKQGGDIRGDHRSIKSRSSKGLDTAGKPKVITRLATICLELRYICTEMCGSFITALFPKDILSTIAMGIGRIMTSLTLSSRQAANMLRITGERGHEIALQAPESICLDTLSRLQQRGIEARKVELGIGDMPKRYGLVEKSLREFACSVVTIIRSLKEHVRKVSAPLLARVKRAVGPAWMISRRNVLYAVSSLRPISIPGRDRAQESAVASLPAEQKDVWLIDKETVTGSGRVYDLTVEDAHCFYAEDILVSNCHDAIQYVCVMLHVSASPPVRDDDIYPSTIYEETY